MVAEQRVPPGIRRLQPGLPSSWGSRIAKRGAGRRSALFSQNAPVPTPEDRLAGALERSTTTGPPRTTQPGLPPPPPGGRELGGAGFGEPHHSSWGWVRMPRSQEEKEEPEPGPKRRKRGDRGQR